MVKQATTVGTCCYIGCTKSFLTDKETPFFKFPDELERRKKWIANCGNPELGSLAERQLRGKRICINHFSANSFTGASGDKNVLKDTAIPVAFKKGATPASTPATPTSSSKSVAVTPSVTKIDETGSAPPSVKRGRGRPPKIKQEVLIKCEPAEDESDDEGVAAPRITKEKAVAPPTLVKEKPGATANTEKGVGTSGVTKEKSDVISTPNKDKPSVGSNDVTEKAIELSSAKKRMVRGRASLTPNVTKGKAAVLPVAPKEKPPVTPNLEKEKSSSSDGWKPFAPAIEKPVDTPVKEKTIAVLATNKERLVSTPATTKEKLVSSPVTTKGPISNLVTTKTPANTPVTTKTSVNTPGTTKEKPVSTPGATKTPISSPGAAKTTANTPGTPKTTVSTSGTAKTPISNVGTTKEKSVNTPGKTKEKALGSAGAKEKVSATTGTTREKPVSALGTAKEKVVGATGTAKEKCVGTPGAIKEKPVGTPGTTKEKAAGTPDIKEKVATTGTTKEKAVGAPGTAKEKAVSTPGTTKEKGVGNLVTTKEKVVVAPNVSAKEKSLEQCATKKKGVAAKGKAAVAQGKGKASTAAAKEKAMAVSSEEKGSAEKGEEKKALLVLGPVKEKLGAVKLLNEEGTAGGNNSSSSAQGAAVAKARKRKKLTKTEKDLKSKLRKIAVDIIQPNSEVMEVDSSSSSSGEDIDEDVSHSLGSSDEEEKKASVADNREFERFHKTLKANCVLPESWNLGAVLWDPSRKMKVIPASEVDISANGTVRLKRSVQIFETMQTKVTVDGFDLTNRYDVKTVIGHQDVTRLILRVARSKICCGIKSISTEDAMYFPDAVPRGTTFYSEACPVIISKQSMGPLCNSCHKLRNAIRRRKSEQKRAVEMRKAKRSSLHTVNSPFGKALYTLLSDLMADENDPKRKKKRNTLYSRGHNVCLKDKDGEAGDKNSTERATNSASISYIMQDIVSKMSLGKMPQEQQPQYFKTEDDQMGMQILNGTLDSNSGNLVVQNAADFTLAEGQEYELIGEVDPNDVQVVEMIKERPNSPQIEIIEVDDHTLAQLAAQNMSGMFLQDSGQIHVNMAEVDVNNPTMSQLLKVIGPSHGF